MKSKINNINSHVRKLQKKRQYESKLNKRKEIMRIKAKINEIEKGN